MASIKIEVDLGDMAEAQRLRDHLLRSGSHPDVVVGYWTEAVVVTCSPDTLSSAAGLISDFFVADS